MKKVWIVLVLMVAVIISSCTKNRKSQGLMDDPQTHYMQGKKYWEKGEYDRAMEEFKLSKTLNKKYGPAYAGIAITYAAKGDFDKANDFAEDAIDYCKKDPTGYIAMGIVKHYELMNSKKEDWWEEPIGFFNKALKLAPDNAEIHYRKGITYKIGYEFGRAEDNFKKVLDLKNGYEAEANEQWEIVQKIRRASPGTRVGKKIALVDKISRADLAALFINELELDRILEKRKVKTYETDFVAPADPRKFETETTTKTPDILDIEGHWAKNFILDLQKFRMRGLEPSPDHKFYPNEFVTRAEYAFFIEDILIAISGDKTLGTKHIGATTSRFPDVNPGSPYYNAICNAVDKNIMNANLSGEFNPTSTVPGPDALLVIRAIKELRR